MQLGTGMRLDRQDNRPLSAPVSLRQGDALKGTDDVIGPFGGEKAFIVTGAEVPVRSLVIFVPIKAPDATDHNDAAHPVVPEIADVMKAEVCPRVGAFETNVIVKHEFRQADDIIVRLDSYFAGSAGVVSERP